MGVKIQHRKKDDKYYIAVHYKGTRLQQYAGKGEDGRRVAEESAPKIAAAMLLHPEMTIDQMTAAQEKKVKGITFKSYSEKQMRLLEHVRSVHTLADYSGMLNNHIYPVLGKLPIDSITRPIAKDFVHSILTAKSKKPLKEGETEKNLSKASVAHIFSTVRMIMNCAVDDEIIQVNPFNRLGKLIGKISNQEEIDFLTPEETVLFLNSVKDNYPYYYPVLYTLVRTGLRVGECTALKWDDIDFAGRFIKVCRATDRDGSIKDTKTGKNRRVDMSQALTEVLQEHRRASKVSRECQESLNEIIPQKQLLMRSVERGRVSTGLGASDNTRNLYVIHSQQPANPEGGFLPYLAGYRLAATKNKEDPEVSTFQGRPQDNQDP